MTVSSDLALIESRIADAVDRFMALDADDTIEGPCLTISREVARQALVSSEGGKRLRALLALHAFDATDPQGHDDDGAHARGRDAVLDLACAIEVFQTAALVHDDIIDDLTCDGANPRPTRRSARRRTARRSAEDWASCWETCSPPPASTSPMPRRSGCPGPT